MRSDLRPRAHVRHVSNTRRAAMVEQDVSRFHPPTEPVHTPQRPASASRPSVPAIAGIIAAVAVATIAVWRCCACPARSAVLDAGPSRDCRHRDRRQPPDGDRGLRSTSRLARVTRHRRWRWDIEAIMPLMGQRPHGTRGPPPGRSLSRRGVPLMMTGPWQLRISIPPRQCRSPHAAASVGG